MNNLPGGELAARPLHFIWVCDCSGSMAAGGKIQSLNTAIREALPQMQKVADENPNAQVLVRVLTFSSGARWLVPQPTPVADFAWSDLSSDGVTDMGKALTMLADQLKIPPMTGRALPPVLVLISDGQPTDDFQDGLKSLMGQPWGKKAVRMAIAIGEDADLDILQQFIGNAEIKPLLASNPESLVRQIKWVSTQPRRRPVSPGAVPSRAGTSLSPSRRRLPPALPAPTTSGRSD
jgi:uncharacterized protein YegL